MAQAEPAQDEMFCSDCGEIIKENAEICPECGVRQVSGSKYSDNAETRRLQKVAETEKWKAVLVGFFISPAGYVYIGKNKLAILNLATLNYLILGIVIVPLHVMRIIDKSREELDQMDEDYELP